MCASSVDQELGFFRDGCSQLVDCIAYGILTTGVSVHSIGSRMIPKVVFLVIRARVGALCEISRKHRGHIFFSHQQREIRPYHLTGRS